MDKGRVNASGQVMALATRFSSKITVPLTSRSPAWPSGSFKNLSNREYFYVVAEYALQATSGFRRTRVDQSGQFIADCPQ